MDKLKMAFPFAHQIAIAIGIVIVWIIVNKVVSLTTSRGFDLLHKRLVKNGKNGSRPAALQRIETLKGITLNVVKWLIAVIFVLSLIGSFGVNITPILTGVGLAGLGISMAAQNIIRDFLNGIFVVLEDHYGVGDWINTSMGGGTVEKLTLRTTHLRDIDGNLIIIPNGSINGVTNYTKNWSRAAIKIRVPFDSDVRKAMKIMEETAHTLQRENSSLFIGSPTVQGILDFLDSSMVLRTLFDTTPGDQWALSREYRLRVKEAFDEANIPMAIPQTEVRLHSLEPKKIP
ncbi:MAG: mechanosensitive ion channel family protein [Aminobacterium colombiense]|jgi:small-conductance mechanosensitive channel|uniref:MscS Mechanosensitive ion channel n=1 Tax=Aminobacterium colombiense (strain DSM 12261 / ALA-1) TaxID=572547 RepID=D5EDS0_AMICL|nr:MULTISPECIES: mechanosensitive ion channel family protein [Aminobacterium]MDD2379256.1 mechanosensitive ion channel family protein [Aminobacterium colombiense]ADE56702.1 MscS Mechanosensitive ion channel [Aminobacterium colombiense DSM 12261]MDD3767984.1 mechanosensitive ion channel family protein [Aminobacterium colombiense]MDD4265357.1 mechanosensitive ion channel family protein [Aminobacterium colombiense]MDD4585929.1 mechanosensitive ion channel family protein [Aminobacterium colombiens